MDTPVVGCAPEIAEGVGSDSRPGDGTAGGEDEAVQRVVVVASRAIGRQLEDHAATCVLAAALGGAVDVAHDVEGEASEGILSIAGKLTEEVEGGSLP